MSIKAVKKRYFFSENFGVFKKDTTFAFPKQTNGFENPKFA